MSDLIVEKKIIQILIKKGVINEQGGTEEYLKIWQAATEIANIPEVAKTRNAAQEK